MTFHWKRILFLNLLKVIFIFLIQKYPSVGICSPYNFVANKFLIFILKFKPKTSVYFFEDGLGFYSEAGINSPIDKNNLNFFQDYSGYLREIFHKNPKNELSTYSFFYNENLNLNIKQKFINKEVFFNQLHNEYMKEKANIFNSFNKDLYKDLSSKENLFIFSPNLQLQDYEGYKKVLKIFSVKRDNSFVFIKKNFSDNFSHKIPYSYNLSSYFSLELYSCFFSEFFSQKNVYFVGSVSTFYYTNPLLENNIIDISYIKGNKEFCDLSRYKFLKNENIIYLAEPEDLIKYYN